MEQREFMESKWLRAAQDPTVQSQVLEDLPGWIAKVRNSDLTAKARRLKDYLVSGRGSTADIILIVAALLYLISPIDAVPDFIPFAGWLDDVAVAGLVLSYLDKKASSGEGGSVDL
ncbi:MAG: YkvA family protein [Desulfomonilaceae bacterium]|nr:YkvA family protein [Desulfomonilaceae bacterium]